jgi:hypothetical protein
MPNSLRKRFGFHGSGFAVLPPKTGDDVPYALVSSQEMEYCNVSMSRIPDIVAEKRAGSRFSLHPRCFDSREAVYTLRKIP